MSKWFRIPQRSLLNFVLSSRKGKQNKIDRLLNQKARRRDTKKGCKHRPTVRKAKQLNALVNNPQESREEQEQQESWQQYNKKC